MSENFEKKFDCWCIVELFGHSKIAGRCTEQNIAGTNMLRVDVPETKDQPAFTRFFGASAIYAINPVDEKTARVAAEGLQIAPIAIWQADTFIKKFNDNKPALAGPAGNSNESYGDEDDHMDDLPY